MKFMLIIYNDPKLYDALPAAETDGMMRDCLAHADELRRDGCLQESQMLEDAQTAKSVRIRGGRTRITDGPEDSVQLRIVRPCHPRGAARMRDSLSLPRVGAGLAWTRNRPHTPHRTRPCKSACPRLIAPGLSQRLRLALSRSRFRR